MPIQLTVEQIAEKIKLGPKTKKPIMIGIEGFGGSGKSTFANKLKSALGDSYVINFDDFLIKDKISDADKSGFDKQRLEQQVLLPAKNNKPIAYQRLVWAKNALSEPIEVPNCTYIIIEGVSCYHPSIANYYDYKIWVQTPMDDAKQRGSQRDKDLGSDNDKLWEVWAKTDLEYQSKHHPEQVADFVFENSASF